ARGSNVRVKSMKASARTASDALQCETPSRVRGAIPTPTSTARIPSASARRAQSVGRWIMAAEGNRGWRRAQCAIAQRRRRPLASRARASFSRASLDLADALHDRRELAGVRIPERAEVRLVEILDRRFDLREGIAERGILDRGVRRLAQLRDDRLRRSGEIGR